MKRLLPLVVLLAALPAQARDPMSPPEAPAAAARQPAAEAPPPLRVHQLLVVDGQRYVVHQGRRRAVGEQIGEARIVAIDDNAVLLRQGSTQWRVPLFAGVTRRPATEATNPPATSTAAASAPSPRAPLITARRATAPRGDTR